MSKHVVFKDIDSIVNFGSYPQDGPIGIYLDAAETERNRKNHIFPGERVIVATVLVPDAVLAKNETVIKNFSENEEILEILIDNKIVEDTGKTVQVGFETCPIVTVLQ